MKKYLLFFTFFSVIVLSTYAGGEWEDFWYGKQGREGFWFGESSSGGSSSSDSSSYSSGEDEYVISTHTYTRSDGVVKSYGVFSGAGNYVDDPSAAGRVNEGPIPPGIYTLRYVGYHPDVGPDAVECIPSSNNVMGGRSGFYIHGGSNSRGCIIINDPAFRQSLDGHRLIVR